MIGISGPDTLGFGYDGLGRRRSLTVNGRTTVTLYDGWNPIQLQENGVAVENRLMGLGLDAIYARVRDGLVESYSPMPWVRCWNSAMRRRLEP